MREREKESVCMHVCVCVCVCVCACVCMRIRERKRERERERERRPSTLRGCRRETNYFPQQHASMLFTAHNELFERLRLYREYKISSPLLLLLSSLRSFSSLSIFFPALRRNAPEYFRPANFPIANDLDAEIAPVHPSAIA